MAAAAVNLFHIFFVATFLFYLGYMGNKGVALDNRIYKVLMVVGVLVGLYHAYIFNQKRMNK